MKAGRWLRRHKPLAAAIAAVVIATTVIPGVCTVIINGLREREHGAKLIAQKNFDLARSAVDRFHTEVSEKEFLNEPGMDGLRNADEMQAGECRQDRRIASALGRSFRWHSQELQSVD